MAKCFWPRIENGLKAGQWRVGRNKVACVKREDKFGKNKFDHAVEKLTDTLKCLATHPGDARERITAAYFSFGHLQAEEFPEECRKDWAWIKKEITKFGLLPIAKAKFGEAVSKTL